MRIYTRRGDDGTTGRLLGGRVPKDDPAVETSGAVDEAVAFLGAARAATSDAEVAALLLHVQRQLFVVGADLAANPRRRERLVAGTSLVVPEMVEELERAIDRVVAEHPLRPVFIVPGANPASAALDVARSVLRRAERRAVSMRASGHTVNEQALAYLNRLSDLLFALARAAAGDAEEPASHD